jgi:hypothetical protein
MIALSAVRPSTVIQEWANAEFAGHKLVYVSALLTLSKNRIFFFDSLGVVLVCGRRGSMGMYTAAQLVVGGTNE